MKDIIQKRLEAFGPLPTAEDELNALKEITQEVALYALQRAGFFERASFVGGTCLRILHGLDRFSEDLDFSTRGQDPEFDLDTYLRAAMALMAPYGYELTMDSRQLEDRGVQSRFLKDTSIKKVLTFTHRHDERQKIKIKVEVDTNPPSGAVEETAFIDFPDDAQILSHDLPSLMAGKIHALLCRAHTKGRDWYDFLWYVKNGHAPNLTFLEHALRQHGPWKGKSLRVDTVFLQETLSEKVSSLDWNSVKADVRKFLSPEKARSLDLWSAEFFASKVKKLTLS